MQSESCSSTVPPATAPEVTWGSTEAASARAVQSRPHAVHRTGVSPTDAAARRPAAVSAP